MTVLPTLVKFASSIAFAGMFIPPLILFTGGIESGMGYIDRLYPHPQLREPLYKQPLLIYWHIYANIIALGIHIALLWLNPPHISVKLHSRLAWLYTLFVISGTLASIRYASLRSYGDDGGKSATFAFTVMALATFYASISTLFYGFVRKNVVLHREWATRSFAILFGNGVFFRILANSYLVWMQKIQADFYSSWVQMIYLSWIIPLFSAEQYLAWVRASSQPQSTAPGSSMHKAHPS